MDIDFEAVVAESGNVVAQLNARILVLAGQVQAVLKENEKLRKQIKEMTPKAVEHHPV